MASSTVAPAGGLPQLAMTCCCSCGEAVCGLLLSLVPARTGEVGESGEPRESEVREAVEPCARAAGLSFLGRSESERASLPSPPPPPLGGDVASLVLSFLGLVEDMAASDVAALGMLMMMV